jgi:adenylate cyclase
VVTVIFEPRELPDDAAHRAPAHAGDALLDVCDDAQAPVPFSCRDASCGTCLVEVVEGGQVLDAMEPTERLVLLRLGAGPGHRLACRARFARDDGVLRLRPVAPPALDP